MARETTLAAKIEVLLDRSETNSNRLAQIEADIKTLSALQSNVAVMHAEHSNLKERVTDIEKGHKKIGYGIISAVISAVIGSVLYIKSGFTGH